MGKIKDLFRGEHRKFAWFVTITTGLFIGLWFIGPGNTFIHWIRAAREISRQERLIEAYENKNAEMDNQVHLLKHDKDTLEKFAREQFRFAAPGEDVYVIE